MSSKKTDEAANNLSLKFLLLLFCYFALHVLLRVVVSDSLDYDEAEQALLSQWLLAGYTEQPPLYTWVQYFLFELFGKNVFAVSLWKNTLLFLTYVFVFLSAREILSCPRKATLATASLLLIPQICWESQRDMTHTTLVVFAAAVTLWQTLRCLKSQHIINYVLLGILLSLGIYAKANYNLFVVILFLSLAMQQEGRKVLCSKKIVITVLVAAALTSNYFLWMFNNPDIVFSATHKFKQLETNAYQQGVTSLLSNTFLFLTPLWLFYLLIFPQGYWKNQTQETTFHHRFIRNYFLIFFVVLLVVVLLFKVTYVKDRWLQPLLFMAPVFFFSRIESSRISNRQFRLFFTTATVAALGVYTAFTVRTVASGYTHNFCRLNYPISEMAEALRNDGFENGLIISDNRFLAGNMHFQFPDSTAIVPDYHFEDLVNTSEVSSGIVLWRTDRWPVVPPQLAIFVEKTYNIRLSDFPVKYHEQPYKYGPKETITLAAVQIPIASTKNK